jgi:hypothetical protein
MSGDEPLGQVLFDLPAFRDGVGSVDVDGKKLPQADLRPGAIALPGGARKVRVELPKGHQ